MNLTKYLYKNEFYGLCDYIIIIIITKIYLYEKGKCTQKGH